MSFLIVITVISCGYGVILELVATNGHLKLLCRDDISNRTYDSVLAISLFGTSFLLLTLISIVSIVLD